MSRVIRQGVSPQKVIETCEIVAGMPDCIYVRTIASRREGPLSDVFGVDILASRGSLDLLTQKTSGVPAEIIELPGCFVSAQHPVDNNVKFVAEPDATNHDVAHELHRLRAFFDLGVTPVVLPCGVEVTIDETWVETSVLEAFFDAMAECWKWGDQQLLDVVKALLQIHGLYRHERFPQEGRWRVQGNQQSFLLDGQIITISITPETEAEGELQQGSRGITSLYRAGCAFGG